MSIDHSDPIPQPGPVPSAADAAQAQRLVAELELVADGIATRLHQVRDRNRAHLVNGSDDCRSEGLLRYELEETRRLIAAVRRRFPDACCRQPTPDGSTIA